MTRDEIRTKLVEVCKNFSEKEMEDITDTQLLGTEEGIFEDSLDHMEFIMDIEESLSIDITDDEVHNWKTFGELVNGVANKLGAPA